MSKETSGTHQGMVEPIVLLQLLQWTEIEHFRQLGQPYHLQCGRRNLPVNPITCNVEEEICQKIDFRKNRAVFSSTEDEAHAKTVELLERIYNGEDGKPRTRRERKFFGDAISVINQFQQTVNQYLAQPTPANEQAVRNELQIEQELLGFKYWIIRSSKVLEDVFRNDIKWNKR